ncbi:MAG: hypothetical protein JST85_27400 [Acidobacteria bacterium]|nr:hypothetical protein [Acidobacteriota bacterium]
MRSKRPAFHQLFGLFLFALTVFGASLVGQAAEPGHWWTTIGSSGSPGPVTRRCVSPGNPFVIFLNCPPVLAAPVVLSTASIGLEDIPAYSGPVAAPLPDYDYEDKVIVRYNVTAVEGLFTDSANGIRMLVKYLDAGEHAQVTVKLQEFNFSTGAITTRLSFDSNQYADSTGYQLRYASDTTKPDFDFVKNAYYIEATLKMTHSPIYGLDGPLTAPKLAAVRLEKTFLLNFPIDISIPEP